MKKYNYKPGMLLLITLLVASITVTAEEVSKEFHKEYTAGANTTLDLSNRYGDVVIQSWDKDQVVIDVKITIDLPSREKAEKLLSYIDVQFSEEPDLIKARTVIEDNFNYSGWGRDSRKFSIDYNVKMPVKAALALANKYGNTDIDLLQGLVNLDIKYGNLNAGKLTRGQIKPYSKITIAYGKGKIEESGWLDLNLRYVGSMGISKCQALLIDSKYSKLTLGETSSVVGISKYDNYNIDKISNLVLENGYTETNIGTLTKSLSFKGSYGSFSVEQIPTGFETLDTETRYMGVRLGIDNSANYQLSGKVSYGGLKYNEDNFKNQRRIVENNSSEISGIVGTVETPSSKVNVVASYGSVKLY